MLTWGSWVLVTPPAWSECGAAEDSDRDPVIRDFSCHLRGQNSLPCTYAAWAIRGDEKKQLPL